MHKIVSGPRVLGGLPALEGTRSSVAQVLGPIAKGMSVGDVIKG